MEEAKIYPARTKNPGPFRNQLVYRSEPAPARGRFPLSAVLLLLLLVVVAVREWPTLTGSRHAPATPREVTARGDLAPIERSTIELFENAKRSVVHITTTQQQRYRTMSGVQAREVEAGSGSGFVWDPRGFVVTNYHVVRGAENIYVRLANGDYIQAFLVGTDPEHDLAVLRIDAGSRDLAPVLVGTSDDLHVGQNVYAIGNPFGLDWTLTTGVVSGLERSIFSVTRTPIDGVIQTDAAINPGNSGGPLLDSAGRLIGVNTAIYSPSGASVGIGFAVPVDTVNAIVPELIEHGRPPRPGLGVVLLPDRVAQANGIEGLIVSRVSPGGAGERAGIRPLIENEAGVEQIDIITAVDGKQIRRRDELTEALRGKKVGDRVEVELERDGARERVELLLQDVGG